MAKRFERDKDEKIRLIYEAFTKLVNTTGYEKVTTRRIAEEADISIGIIYHYFPQGKPAIAAGLYEKNFLEVSNIDGFTDPKKIEVQIRNHLKTHREHMELYRAFDQAILAKDDLFKRIKKERRAILSKQIEKNNLLEDLVKRYLIVYLMIDAVIHRHLYIEAFFDTDEELITFLVKLITLGIENGLL